MISWINRKRNKKGFTLIELIVVVAILGILIALAIPRFATIRANAQAGTNESVAASILAAAEIYWVEKGEEPAGEEDGNLVQEEYLKEWPAAQDGEEFELDGEDGIYTVTYPVPEGADTEKYTGIVPKSAEEVVNP